MSLFSRLFKDVLDVTLSTFTENLRIGHTASNGHVIERLCQELGWPVDERKNDQILLYFGGGSAPVRKVAIMAGEVLMSFYLPSRAMMSANRVSNEIMGHLLVRNAEPSMSSWRIEAYGSGNALFSLGACVPIRGMDSQVFKYVCETMVNEVAAFESKMQAAGLL